MHLAFLERLPRSSAGKVVRAVLAKRAEAQLEEQAGTVLDDAAAMSEAAAPLRAMGAVERADHLSFLVAGLMMTELGLEVDMHDPLMEAGMTSAGAVTLTSALGMMLGVPLSVTLPYDYPNVSKLAAHLAELVGGVPTSNVAPMGTPLFSHPPHEERSPGSSSGENSSDDFVMVRSPTAGSAPTMAPLSTADGGVSAVYVAAVAARGPLMDFDKQAVLGAPAGVDAARPLPCARLEGWDTTKPPPMTFGAFVADVDVVDLAALHVCGPEAALIDPQHPLLLECAVQAVANSPTRTLGETTAAMVGQDPAEYARLAAANGADVRSAYAATALGGSLAAGRLSYHFGLNGPAATMDTACSSALVALHYAFAVVDRAECGDALGAGAHLSLTPAAAAVLARAHMLSADGRCKALDARADGYGRGEAVGIVVLTAAPHAGTIVARLAAGAVNQDGRSSALAAPNGVAQMTLLSSAMADGSHAARDVLSLQLHATGTALGDPIEVSAVVRVLLEPRARSASPLALAAAKAAVGHGEAAAGLVGVVHSLATLAVRHLAATPHLVSVNAHAAVPLSTPRDAGVAGVARAPCAVPMGWCGVLSALVATSAFGISGTNAHMLMAPTTHSPPAAMATALPWERTRAWIVPPCHWLLTRSLSATSAAAPSVTFEANLRPTAGIYHNVNGVSLLSAATLLELALAAADALRGDAEAGAAIAVATVALAAPTTAAEAAARTFTVVVQGASLAVLSTSTNGNSLTHLTAAAAAAYGVPASSAARLTASPEAARAAHRFPVASSAAYRRQPNASPAVQLLRGVRREAASDGAALAAMDGAKAGERSSGGYLVAPALTHATLQLGLTTSGVPTALAAFSALRRLPAGSAVRAAAATTSSADTRDFSLAAAGDSAAADDALMAAVAVTLRVPLQLALATAGAPVAMRYVGAWVLTMATATAAATQGRWLVAQAKRASASATATPTTAAAAAPALVGSQLCSGRRLLNAEFIAPRGSGGSGASVSELSSLLAVAQTAPYMGVGNLQLRTFGATAGRPWASSPAPSAGNPTAAAMHGLMLTVAAERALPHTGIVDSDPTAALVPHSGSITGQRAAAAYRV